jgi:phosphate transport system protein
MLKTADHHLEEIKNLILSMGGFVERALEEAVQSLLLAGPQPTAAKLHYDKVHELESKINDTQIKVDNECMAFVATQGPVAKDLRFIISVIKINADLERMGDQCVNMAYSTKEYMQRKERMADLNDIERMSQIVREMVKMSLDCFVRENTQLAEQVLRKDDEVDALKQKVFEDCSAAIRKNSAIFESGLDLILIARNLERLGDHATNIAEDVIFVSTGKDVRHGKYSES